MYKTSIEVFMIAVLLEITWVPVVSALLGAIGGFFVMLTKYWSYRAQMLKHTKNLEVEIKDLSAPLVMNLQAVNHLQELVTTIFEKTEATRFLILVATNGTREMRQCTVVYEQHMAKEGITTSIGASGRYINFKFDETYKQMLKAVEYNGPEFFLVKDMPDCDLKSIYQAERVTSSKVFFLRRTKIDNENDRVWYCSIATHKEDGFIDEDKIHIRYQIGQIQHLLKEMK